MIISKIKVGNIIYYNLHAEQTVTDVYYSGSNIGINNEQLSKNTLERVATDFKQNNNKYDLILDFDNLNTIQNNLLPTLIEIKKSAKLFAFLNIQKRIIEKLGDKFINGRKNQEINGFYKIFYLTQKFTIEIKDGSRYFQKKFSSYLKKHSVKPKTINSSHFSSSVYISPYIDVKSMIADQNDFFVYSLYILALKIKAHWMKDLIKPILVCQNLNSAYIASILSSFLGLDILIFDKLGPINKLYSVLDKKVEENKPYLVVSDVVCLGTEVKIAKSLITFLGGKYLGNVTLIRIETLSPKDYDIDEIEQVFSVSRNNNPIKYKITTALDKKEKNEK